MNMFCTKCGQQVPDGSKVCPFCGNQLAAAAPAQAAPVSQPAPKAAKAGIGKYLPIIGIAAAVVVVIVALFLIFSGGPKSVVKEYKKLMEDRNEAVAKKNKEVNKIDEKLAELDWSCEKAQKALKLLKDENKKDVEKTWKITDSETFSGDDKEFKGMIAGLTAEGATTKSVKKLAIVEVKTYDKNDKNDKGTFEYFSLAKIGGSWYILDINTSAKSIQDAANEFAELAGK